MTDVRQVSCHPLYRRALWFFVGLGAAGAGVAGVRSVYWGPDPWLGVGLLFALVGIAALHAVTARVSADAYGLCSRTLLRRRIAPWSDVADLRVRLKHGHQGQEIRRVGLVLRDGRKWVLPLPQSRSSADADFDAQLDALRALHRRYGAPESGHVPVVTDRTAGRGWAGALSLCVLLLACAGVAGAFVPDAASDLRAWKSATPCSAETPATKRGECLTVLPAVIARTEANRPKQSSWVYFAGNRPVERVAVSREDAQAFRPGDRVELTAWRGKVRKIAGERHVWREHMPAAGDLAAVAAAFVLAAGYPGARVLLRLRGRRLPDDEVLPSALPFAVPLVGTALWLLPLCYLHPTTPLDSVAIRWAAAGSLVTLGLLAWAWRATRIRTPEEAEEAEEAGATGGSAEGEEVFLAARFLEDTDYNPYGFGTHIVLGGGGPLAVTPHPGPGRFAAKRIPVERLTVKDVRRARGGDGDTIPTTWHIADLDDAGNPVRLAAAPADLNRIIRALGSAKSTAKTPAKATNREP
ncbi:PH domain-containing protein [Streptomyces sp. NPDC058092]|uniref:PH domain-containing protein n=1 Tax=Streptomyces sp. NPDC058092 TaxID=3346336 RepID=UPI0036E56B35